MNDPIDIRHVRAARARERCLQEMRRHLGEQLPRPVVSAVSILTDTLLQLAETPDDQLEKTVY